MIALSLRSQLVLIESVAALLRSGVPLRESLLSASDILQHGRGPANRSLHDVAAKVADKVSAGMSARMAFQNSFRNPDSYIISMCHVVDATGQESNLFTHMEHHLRSKTESVQAIRSALLYPILVLSLTIVGSAGLAFFVVPMFTALLQEAGLVDAVSVAALIRSSSRFAWILVVLLIATTSAGLALRVYSLAVSSSRRAPWWSEITLRLPISGRLRRARELLTFLEAGVAGIECGIPLDRALALGASCITQPWMRQALIVAVEHLRNGHPPSLALRKVFGPFHSLLRFLEIPEQGGNLLDCTITMKDTFSELWSGSVRRLRSWLEPAAVLAAGLVVLLSVIFLVRPLLLLTSQVQL